MFPVQSRIFFVVKTIIKEISENVCFWNSGGELHELNQLHHLGWFSTLQLMKYSQISIRKQFVGMLKLAIIHPQTFTKIEIYKNQLK